jgi:hypothetical protein
LAQLGAVFAYDRDHLRDQRIMIWIDFRDRRRTRNIHKRPIGSTLPLRQLARRFHNRHAQASTHPAALERCVHFLEKTNNGTRTTNCAERGYATARLAANP